MDKFVEDLSGDTKRKSTGIYRNLQESTLFPKIHSHSQISLWWQINGSSERPLLLSLWKCPLPEGIKAYDDISIASPLMSHGPSNPNHTLDLNKSTDPFNPIQ